MAQRLNQLQAATLSGFDICGTSIPSFSRFEYRVEILHRLVEHLTEVWIEHITRPRTSLTEQGVHKDIRRNDPESERRSD